MQSIMGQVRFLVTESQWILEVKATTGEKWTDLVLLSLPLIITLPTDISMLILYISRLAHLKKEPY